MWIIEVYIIRLINQYTGQFETIRPNSIQITQTKEFLKDISLSTINEILLNRTESEWKGEVYSWESLINLLASKIEDMINTVVRQISFFEFEKMILSFRKKIEADLEF